MFPFIAALSQAAGIIVDKIILTRRRMEIHVFIPVLFLFLFLVTAILMPFLGSINFDFFKPYYLLIFGGMITSALIWNVFYYKGVQVEKVQNFQLIILLQPLLTIILAAFLLEKTINLNVLIASIIASVALIFSQIEKKHLEINRSEWGIILAVIFISIEIILQKIMLEVFSPAALYFVRTGIIFLFFIFYYHPRFSQVSNINTGLILLTSFLGVTQMVTKFYGFQEFGVIYTSLVLILSPILVYIISIIGLHERLKARIIVSALVILLCIIYVTVLGK